MQHFLLMAEMLFTSYTRDLKFSEIILSYFSPSSVTRLSSTLWWHLHLLSLHRLQISRVSFNNLCPIISEKKPIKHDQVQNSIPEDYLSQAPSSQTSPFQPALFSLLFSQVTILLVPFHFTRVNSLAAVTSWAFMEPGNMPTAFSSLK